MNLLFDSDTLTKCGECGQPCRQREITAAHGKHARRVPFQTHALSLADEAHSGVFQRVSAFYTRMFQLLDELQAIPSDELKLSYGRLIGLELGAVMPSACAIRTQIVPMAIVRVAGLERAVELPAIAIAEATAAEIVTSLKVAAEPIAATLNGLYEARDF